MTKTLLRSGNLDDVQSVGGGGQPVFTFALQIRETLRLQNHEALAACLAVPQVNEDGDRVDWYAPRAGSVVAWKAADEPARERARAQLDARWREAQALSALCQHSPKTARRLFGALLEKALQFPGPNHVFLVDDAPVIAFWGFVALNEPVREAPFACLAPPEAPRLCEPALPSPAAGPAAAYRDVPETPPEISLPPAPEPAEPAEPAVVAEPAEAPARPRRGRFALLALPVVAAAVAALLFADRLPLRPAASAPPAPAIPAAPAQPMLSGTLPLRPAAVIPPPPPPAKTAVLAAVPKEALVMEADQLRAGTTAFLNGTWRVVLDAKDAATGRAPSLRYQIKNNKGTARLVHGDSVVCKAAIFAGLHQNGELLIKNRGLARCGDGSRYPLPVITCTAGTSGVAQCRGRFGAGTDVPLTFHKVGR